MPLWGILRKKGMTPMELSNIRSLMTGQGAVFAADSLRKAGGSGESRTFTLDLRQSGGIASVTLAGASVPFTLKGNVLTVHGGAGEGVITLKDGGTLAFVLA